MGGGGFSVRKAKLLAKRWNSDGLLPAFGNSCRALEGEWEEDSCVFRFLWLRSA